MNFNANYVDNIIDLYYQYFIILLNDKIFSVQTFEDIIKYMFEIHLLENKEALGKLNKSNYHEHVAILLDYKHKYGYDNNNELML